MRIRTLSIAIFTTLFACGISTQRNPDAPAQTVTYNDECQLQSYFDERNDAHLLEHPVLEESVTQTEQNQRQGESVYEIADRMAKIRLLRMLREEFSGIDEDLLRKMQQQEPKPRLRVRWYAVSAYRTLVPKQEHVLIVGNEQVNLPYNACVGELLFGAKLYAKRRSFIRREVDFALGRVDSSPADVRSAQPSVSTSSQPPASSTGPSSQPSSKTGP